MPRSALKPLFRALTSGGCIALLVAMGGSMAAADEVAPVSSCGTTVDVAALGRALESRKPSGAAGWEIGIRSSDCMLTVTDARGVWLSGIRADREPTLVAAEVSWAWLHRERALKSAEAAAEAVATAAAKRVRTEAALAAKVSAPAASEPVRAAPVEPQTGQVGFGATALNGRPVRTLSAGYGLPIGAGFVAGAEGWCSLETVASQFVFVDSGLQTSARPEIRVASVGGFIGSSTRLAGLDLGVRSGVALVWAHAALESELATVSDTAWLPEASVHGRMGMRFGNAEPAVEVGYRAVVGDDRVVGPSEWAFAGPSASVSLGWRVE